MSMTLTRFRREAAKLRAERTIGSRRYSTEMKNFAIELARQRKAEGKSTSASARELGVGDMTLRKWLKSAERSLAFVPVVVREPEASSVLTLRAPGGFELTGLDVPTAAALLRALG